MTGPTYIAANPEGFYCCNCRKDVSVLTHSPHEILRLFRGDNLFPHSTFEIGNIKLGTATLSGQPTEPRRAGMAMRLQYETSFGRSRQGVPLLRGPDRG